MMFLQRLRLRCSKEGGDNTRGNNMNGRRVASEQSSERDLQAFGAEDQDFTRRRAIIDRFITRCNGKSLKKHDITSTIASALPEHEDANTAEWSMSSGDNFAHLTSFALGTSENMCTSQPRSILRKESLICEPQDRKEEDRTPIVRFGTITIRDYDIILGDHPACSYGPPITISWEYHENDPQDVHEYEVENALTRRSLRDLTLNYYQRKYLLSAHTELEFKAVIKEIKRINAHRKISMHASFYEDAFDSFIESACRKLNKMLKRRK